MIAIPVTDLNLLDATERVSATFAEWQLLLLLAETAACFRLWPMYVRFLELKSVISVLTEASYYGWL